MKSLKYMVATACTAIALAPAAAFAADSINFAGVGSSAQFAAFAQASKSTATGTFKIYTSKTGASLNNGVAGSTPESGNFWLTVNIGGGNRVYNFYLQTDSTIGNRAFFRSESLSLSSASLSASGTDITIGGNVVAGDYYGSSDGDISTGLTLANNQIFNVGLTDITPADALVATNKGLALGYNGTTNPIVGENSSGSTTANSSKFNVIPFALSSRAFSLQTVGAAPIIVVVNTQTGGSGHFGDTALTDINRFVLARYLDGTFVRTGDAFNTVGTIPAQPTGGEPGTGTGFGNYPAKVFIRELLSGTYNTMEYCIPNSREVSSTQEASVSATANNPLNETSTSVNGGGRIRAIGTGATVALANSTPDSLTYAFFSTGNFNSGNANHLKYLTVDGVDGIKASTDGIPYGTINLDNVRNGRYAIWSLLRAVTPANPSAGITTLINAATNSGGGTNFAAANTLTVFRSHRATAAVPSPSNGIAPGTTEAGADAGGAVYTIQAELDFNYDTGLELVNDRQ